MLLILAPLMNPLQRVLLKTVLRCLMTSKKFRCPKTFWLILTAILSQPIQNTLSSNHKILGSIMWFTIPMIFMRMQTRTTQKSVCALQFIIIFRHSVKIFTIVISGTKKKKIAMKSITTPSILLGEQIILTSWHLLRLNCDVNHNVMFQVLSTVSFTDFVHYAMKTIKK